MSLDKHTSDDLPDEEPRELYSVFTSVEKWCIVAMVSYAAWFSTMTSLIYYPAIEQLARVFSVSVDQINLTVTTYMAVATIGPMLVGDAADVLGRRPVYCVTLLVYIGANVAIVLADSYTALLCLRMLQALAISGTFSISYGVITDVATPADRGYYISAVSFAISVAPSIGPIIGGVLSHVAGWTWIFWFLCIAAGLCLAFMAFMLPETSRGIVGNGSIAPPKYLRLPHEVAMCHWKRDRVSLDCKRKIPNPLKSLKILFRKDNATIITACGLTYVVYTCINASLSILFIRIYHLNQWQAGLVYLPFGVGGTVSTFFSGALLNAAYRNARTELGLLTDNAGGDDLDTFPIEKARLRVMWIPMVVTIGSVVIYGWALHYSRHFAIPLFCQFVVGMCMQFDFSIFNTLIVDKNHRTPSAAQASNNIVRCALAALAVSYLEDMFNAMGTGWTFTFFGGLCFVALSLCIVDYHKGFSWRQKCLPSPKP